jgi:DNA-binding transcriptional MerR regulator
MDKLIMKNGLDTEWKKLIQDARDLGLSIDQIREYIKTISKPK